MYYKVKESRGAVEVGRRSERGRGQDDVVVKVEVRVKKIYIAEEWEFIVH